MDNAKKLNNLEVQKLSVLLTRFYFVLCSSQEFIFTHEEIEKLRKSMNLSSKELIEILDTIKSIIYESIQNTIPPMKLLEMLVNIGLHESHAQVFCDQWAENGKMVVNLMKKVSLAKWQMRGLTCEFHAEAASANTSRKKHPIAVMNLSLFESNFPLQVSATKHNTEANAKELVLQMDKNELYQFYSELEKIQEQLESLKQ